MAAQVISLAERLRAPLSRDWSRQELAEFYRVESALLQAGLELETERGLTDEGDPWFVFCRADTGEVFIHFARCDGWYLVDGSAMGGPSRGRDFGALVRDLISRHPLSDARRPGSNVLMHPAALLIALVGAAFFHSGRAKAAEVAHHDGAIAAGDAKDARRGLTLNVGGAPPAATGDGPRTVALDASEVAAVLTGVAIGLRELADASSAAAAPVSGLAATPASTAFTPAPRDLGGRADRSASADMLGALSASDTRAALTVMAVVHDLARSAAAAASPVVSTASVAVMSVDLALRQDISAAAASPPSKSEPTAMLLVHLAAGPLPQIEALAMVAADGALARVSPDRVVHVDQLPSFLADIVSHGEIVGAPGSGSGSGPGSGSGSDGGTPPPPPTDGSAASVDHTSVQPLTDGSQAHAVGAKAAVEDAHSADVAATQAGDVTIPSPQATPPLDPPTTTQPTITPPLTTPSLTTPPSTTPPSASPPETHPFPSDPSLVVPSTPAPDHAAAGHSPLIDAAVLSFVTAVTNVQVVISGHEVVFYDPQILSTLSFGETLDSITWRLEDGSSVSLVGTVSELHTFHGIG